MPQTSPMMWMMISLYPLMTTMMITSTNSTKSIKSTKNFIKMNMLKWLW